MLGGYLRPKAIHKDLITNWLVTNWLAYPKVDTKYVNLRPIGSNTIYVLGQFKATMLSASHAVETLLHPIIMQVCLHVVNKLSSSRSRIQALDFASPVFCNTKSLVYRSHCSLFYIYVSRSIWFCATVYSKRDFKHPLWWCLCLDPKPPSHAWAKSDVIHPQLRKVGSGYVRDYHYISCSGVM